MIPLAEIRQLFPLESPEDILQLFRKQLDGGDPDLGLLSIVIGYVEHQLTSQESQSANPKQSSFPVTEWALVEELFKKFQAILATIEPGGKATSLRNIHLKPSRENIKRVSDIIWNSLIRSTYNKDRAHLQSIYSYLTTSKLDCFGVAFAVVAGCQLLGWPGVHLAISEDHAWVVKTSPEAASRAETIEVTWHGKGFEDKRGESVSLGVDSQSWLYLAGHSVNCDRFMEVSALILAMNPSLNLSSACLEMTNLQQQLLWMLFDYGHLQKYPMALGCLGELEEFSPSADAKRISSLELYNQAVVAARKWYSDAHVYPYVALGNYYYRKTMYKESFAAWANAGDVIRRYIYSKDDEEVYKELVDIANEQIPSIMKTESSGHSANSILRDPNCFSRLLRFYDGICKWEEGSVTPILHIGWAKPLVSTIGKFDYEIRSQVIIETAEDDEAIPATTTTGSPTATDDTPPTPTLAALTAACGEKLLNPNFLTGGELQPFRTEVAADGKSDEEQNKSNPLEGSDSKEEPAAAAQTIKYNVDADELPATVPIRPVIRLFSQKMKGLSNLLLAEKLNTQAILLQVTAQSVGAGKKYSRGGGNVGDPTGFHNTAGDKTTGGGTGGTHKDPQNNNQNVTNSGNSGTADGGGGGSVGRPKRPRRE